MNWTSFESKLYNGVRCGFLTFDLSFSWSEILFISDHDTKHKYSSGAIHVEATAATKPKLYLL